jgi:hypothetical protein
MTLKNPLDTLLKRGISFLGSRGTRDIYHRLKKEIGHGVHTDAFIICLLNTALSKFYGFPPREADTKSCEKSWKISSTSKTK